MDFLTLLKLAAATWYVSYAITQTHGPGGVFEWVREHVWHGRKGFQEYEVVLYDKDNNEINRSHVQQKNGLLDCQVCLSVWIAIILTLVPDGIVITALAIAGGAMLLHSAAGWRFGG